MKAFAPILGRAAQIVPLTSQAQTPRDAMMVKAGAIVVGRSIALASTSAFAAGAARDLAQPSPALDVTTTPPPVNTAA